MPSSPSILAQPAFQSYDFFLVLDVEATCQEGAGMDYPNEIIESISKLHLRLWLTVYPGMAGLSAWMERQTQRNPRYHLRVSDFREAYVEAKTLRVLHASDGHNPSLGLEITAMACLTPTTGPDGQCTIFS